MTGYLHGDLIDPQTADEVLSTAELSIKAAGTLGVTRLNLHTTELVDGLPARPRLRATGAMWVTAPPTLEKLGELGAAGGVQFCVENLIELVRRCGDAIGEIQVADVPDRCQPGTGEIYYPAIAKALRDMSFRGTVGLEGYAADDDVAALNAFRTAFTG